MSDKNKEIKNFSSSNKISVNLTHPIADCGTKFAGEVVKQYLTDKMTGDLTVTVKDKINKESGKPTGLIAGSKLHFESGVKNHIKGDVKFIYA